MFTDKVLLVDLVTRYGMPSPQIPHLVVLEDIAIYLATEKSPDWMKTEHLNYSDTLFDHFKRDYSASYEGGWHSMLEGMVATHAEIIFGSRADMTENALMVFPHPLDGLSWEDTVKAIVHECEYHLLAKGLYDPGRDCLPPQATRMPDWLKAEHDVGVFKPFEYKEGYKDEKTETTPIKDAKTPEGLVVSVLFTLNQVVEEILEVSTTYHPKYRSAEEEVEDREEPRNRLTVLNRLVILMNKSPRPEGVRIYLSAEETNLIRELINND